jgi:enoyl-CoA hydratase/carnithine racemase
MDAAEMERVGLIERQVAKDGVHTEIDRLARAIAENGPLATSGAKRIIKARMEPGLRAARSLSDELRAALEWTHDVDEGIAAAREGRKPYFTGR